MEKLIVLKDSLQMKCFAEAENNMRHCLVMPEILAMKLMKMRKKEDDLMYAGLDRDDLEFIRFL